MLLAMDNEPVALFICHVIYPQHEYKFNVNRKNKIQLYRTIFDISDLF